MTGSRRLVCSCALLAAAVAVLIVAPLTPSGACVVGGLALAAVLLAPLDPP